MGFYPVLTVHRNGGEGGNPPPHRPFFWGQFAFSPKQLRGFRRGAKVSE